MKKGLLVRLDDWAIFIQNEDGSYSHEHSRMAEPYKYKEIDLLSLGGFSAIHESDLPDIREKQKIYSQFMEWHTRSDGHDGIKGGTMEEFMATRPDLRIL